jgi:hypothetical protein
MMMMMRALKRLSMLVVLVGFIMSCGPRSKTVVQQKPLVANKQISEDKVLSETPPTKPVVEPAPRRIPETDPQLAIKARQKIKRAQKLYAIGEYDRAEALLKESITIFPFLAQAQLTLGKIFLIKGSGTRDMALLNSARLMFEMAGAIDPGLAEIQTLLELFTVRYPE